MEHPKITFWIYYGESPITAVRLPENASDADVKSKALDVLARIPLCDRPTENPGDLARKIVLGHVKTFPGDN